jgi:amino-acid N-acetyltransferase
VTAGDVQVRPARTGDVSGIRRLVDMYSQPRIMLSKATVALYEDVQEFRVAERVADGGIVGCGALHVMWEDLAEVRTLAVSRAWRGTGVGHALLDRLIDDARELGLSRVFCLTFEVPFFVRHGFADMGTETVAPEVYAELVRSPDEGVAEFLDLARVKPNTLGNTRMLKRL